MVDPPAPAIDACHQLLTQIAALVERHGLVDKPGFLGDRLLVDVAVHDGLSRLDPQRLPLLR